MVGTGPLEAATFYLQDGWQVIPVPHRSKEPGIKGWPQLRIGENELSEYFNGQPMNIGLLTGKPSSWVVDVDLDHQRCIELADEHLPPTNAVFGRPGKPRSHRLYRVTGPVSSRRHKSKSAGMLVELRSTGLQTIIPPSTHECGEPIRWTSEDLEPAEVDPGILEKAVRTLADVVLAELGEKRRAGQKRTTNASTPPTASVGTAERCLQSMAQDGHHRSA